MNVKKTIAIDRTYGFITLQNLVLFNQYIPRKSDVIFFLFMTPQKKINTKKCCFVLYSSMSYKIAHATYIYNYRISLHPTHFHKFYAKNSENWILSLFFLSLFFLDFSTQSFILYPIHLINLWLLVYSIFKILFKLVNI